MLLLNILGGGFDCECFMLEMYYFCKFASIGRWHCWRYCAVHRHVTTSQSVPIPAVLFK
jgi:hypothetical protein